MRSPDPSTRLAPYVREMEPGLREWGKRMDDAALMARLAEGDHTAMEPLYDRYGRHVYALAYRMLADAASAENVTQESFVKVWRKASQFDPARGPLATWILHLTYMVTVDVLRSRQSAVPSRFEETPQEVDLSADTAGDAEVALLGAQAREAMLRLPPEQRQALELAYFGAMSQQHITTLLGIPLGTLKGRVRLGLESLRRFLLTPRRKEVRGRVNNLSSQR